VSELRGEGVILRPLGPDDAAPLRALREAPGVADWWGSLEPGFPLADEPDATRFTIVVDGEVAGMIQYTEEEEGSDYRSAEIDVFLDARLQGRGLGTEAVRVLADHLVAERGHHRIVMVPAAENAAAIRSYEKAGFRAVGLLERSWRDESGRWRDEVYMERVEKALVDSAS
jgi:aminoglycoside 6'-N-acetyltransferase